eukprot:TRINITY_DN17959_c0_g1_i2.p1 TRINITY_DN17959_c0_g1~~TRINITY_DN17959_c0_g1_i2.p1  ORF type:complete len:127 (-),score=41.17 TRINITY_DN17959_c0_g1_i2:1193-1573(-)
MSWLFKAATPPPTTEVGPSNLIDGALRIASEVPLPSSAAEGVVFVKAEIVAGEGLANDVSVEAVTKAVEDAVTKAAEKIVEEGEKEALPPAAKCFLKICCCCEGPLLKLMNRNMKKEVLEKFEKTE